MSTQIEGTRTRTPKLAGYESSLALQRQDIALTNANVALTNAQYDSPVIRFTGVLTGHINVDLPLIADSVYILENATSGNFFVYVGGATGLRVAIPQGRRRAIICDAAGANYLPLFPDVRPKRIQVSIAGGAGTQTLAQGESEAEIVELIGAITGNRSVVLPTEDGRKWVVRNITTGAFTVTVKTNAGTGPLVTQNRTLPTYCDGTNIVPSGGESAS